MSYISSGVLQFNENLVNDINSTYWVYFTDINGKSFGTSEAIIVIDYSGFTMTGLVSGRTSIPFYFDYDNNVQGGRTPGTDVDITAVAIGLSDGQYFSTTSVIGKRQDNLVVFDSVSEKCYECDIYSSSNSIKTTIKQVNHGFIPGIVISNSGGTWVKADSSNINTVGRLVIETVLDSNNFVAVQVGNISVSTWSLTPGTYYVVDDSGNGTFVEYSENLTFEYINPIIQAITTNSAQVLPWRADINIGSTGGGGGEGSSGTSGVDGSSGTSGMSYNSIKALKRTIYI
jgi:hypothetical protein